MDKNERLWQASIEEIVRGYKEAEREYRCVFCREVFQKGHIYEMDGALLDAYGAVYTHCKQKHGETVDYLLEQETSLIGISEVQKQLLKLMSEGKDDKAIASEMGIAQSTVRNHRFKLREKEKQSKLFLAFMRSLEEKTKRPINESDQGMIEEVHLSATMIDDRYGITEKEREKTIKTYMNVEGAITQFPAREKKKIILLGEIIKNFVVGRAYSEPEVNEILRRIYEDFSTLRRYLIEYGYLERSDDGKVYRVKE